MCKTEDLQRKRLQNSRGMIGQRPKPVKNTEEEKEKSEMRQEEKIA